MQNDKMIKPPVRLKPLRSHRTADDRFEKDLRLLACALRVWEQRRTLQTAGGIPRVYRQVLSIER